MISDSHFVQRPPGAGNEHSQCSARLSERLRTSTFNENSDIRLFQQEIESLYQCLSSKKNCRENDGSSALNCGHKHHRSIRRFRVCEGRPRLFGGVQRGGGTGNANSSRTVQQWSVIPAAMAGVRLVAPVPVAWAARRRLA